MAWLLGACAAEGVTVGELLDEDAIDLIAERLRTPLQIEMHLTLAFEQAFRLPGAKFATVLETATLSEAELAEYCRRRGLYIEQIQAWRAACVQGQHSARAQQQMDNVQAKADKKRIRELERELRRKEKALAEAAALLILQKKLNAYWGNVDEES